MEGKDLGQDGLLVIVLDDGVAEAHFNFFLYLVAHSLQDLIPGELVALHRAMYPQGKRGVDADDEVEVAGGGSFEDQGGFADGVRCATGH